MKFFKKNGQESNFHSKPIDNNWFELEGQLVVDVYREQDNLVVRSPIAGTNTEDISIVIEKDILKIRGERKLLEKDESKSYFIKETYWGKFSREIVLPVEVDGQRTKAKITNGILIISMPILEREETKEVEVL